MYKVFLRFPEALRPAFPRLKEKLEDPDSGKIHFLMLAKELKKKLTINHNFTINYNFPFKFKFFHPVF
jgi:hypothetical protein